MFRSDVTTSQTDRVDPHTPVIVGVARVVGEGPAAGADTAGGDPVTTDAISLMSDALAGAADDAGAPSLLEAIDEVTVVGGLWRHQDPGRLVAAELGAAVEHTRLTTFGGHTGIAIVADLCERIAAGDLHVAVALGGEANATRHRLRRLGVPYPERPEIGPPAERWGDELEMGSALAVERGAIQPRDLYAVLESALRQARGETLLENRRRSAQLWAGFAAVAATDPLATDRRGLDADTIMAVAADNRMVAFPYTKALCAENRVDHGAAIIVCSAAAADRLGVPRERRVHPHRVVLATDSPSFLERSQVTRAPGLEAAAAAIVDHTGGPGGIDHLDLYACFPSMVEMTIDALDLDRTRRLTQTGGLGFAGAPFNNAAGQGLAAMVDTLRADPGAVGLVQGNGGSASKHAIGLCSTVPAADGYHTVRLGTHPGPFAEAAPDAAGPVMLEGVTVSHGREGPTHALALCRLDEHTRTWARSSDPDVMAAFEHDEWVGRPAHVDGDVLSL